MSENLKHRLRYGWLLGCLLAAAALLLNPGQQDASSTTALPSLQPVSIAPQSRAATSVTSQSIETIRLGQRVLGQNPLWEGAEVVDPDVQSWRRIALRMNLEQGDVLNIELLRPLWWIHAHEVRAGELMDLHLEELGASGPAQVIEIGLCPAIDVGPGSVVTGTFAHTTTQGLVRLSLSGSNEPILVTPSHSFWSETRQDFVPAEDLKPDEELLRYDDTTIALQSIEYVNSDVPVFNIEVHGQHVYHVSTAGVLVHNSCYQTPIPTGHPVRSLTAAERLGIPDTGADAFRKWFDSQSVDDIARLYQDADSRDLIKSRLRAGGGKHEWLMVSRAAQVKAWGGSYDDIVGLVTPTNSTFFRDPVTGVVKKHGNNSVSSRAHIELGHLIDSSNSLDQFKRKLNNWAEYSGWLPGGRGDLPEGLRL